LNTQGQKIVVYRQFVGGFMKELARSQYLCKFAIADSITEGNISRFTDEI